MQLVADSFRIGQSGRRMYDWIASKRRGTTPIEDEVTSCVFGPLRFMDPGQAWASCLMLFDIQDRTPDLQPDRICIRFWPKFFRNDGQGSYVEPDVHILAWRYGELTATILVEVKWGAELGSSQLLDQWRFLSVSGYKGEELRDRSWHVFLSDRPIRDKAAKEEQESRTNRNGIGWHDRLLVKAWHEVATKLDETVNCSGGMEVWRTDLIRFLSAQGVTPFDGFRRERIRRVKSVTLRMDKYALPTLSAVKRVDWRIDQGSDA